MSKITKKELHPSLLKLIEESAGSGGGSGSSKLVQKKNSVNINTPVSSVNIGIPYFDKSTDVLMVYKNSIYLEVDEDYTISADNTTINCVEGKWNTDSIDMVFNFVVFKNVPEMVELDGKLIKDGTVGLDELDETVKNMLNKSSDIKRDFTTGYTGDSENNCFKIARTTLKKESGNVNLTFEFMLTEVEGQHKPIGEVYVILDTHNNQLINSIKVSCKDPRYNKTSFFVKKESETEDTITYVLYVRIIRSHSRLNIHIKNMYTDVNSVFQSLENSDPENYTTVSEEGTIWWETFLEVVESGSSEGDKTGYWAEILRIRLDGQWQEADCIIDFMNRTTSDAPLRGGRIYLRSSQSSQLPEDPYVRLAMTGEINITKNDVKVLMSTDPTQSFARLFIKILDPYSAYASKLNLATDSKRIELYDNIEVIQDLPQYGVIVDCH